MDALGNPISSHLTEGQACELDGADVLLPQLKANIVIADKSFDADQQALEPLQQAGKEAVIPPKANRTVQREYDRELYKVRHLIENFLLNSSSSAPSPLATKKSLVTSSPPSTSPPLSSGSFDDTLGSLRGVLTPYNIYRRSDCAYSESMS